MLFKKYAELRDLYNGKKMHSKALELLKEYVVLFVLTLMLSIYIYTRYQIE